MNLIDRCIAWADPRQALERARARTALAHYEAAQPSRLRKKRSDNQSPNALVQRSAVALRAHARYLERNHDLTRGALRVMVNNIVGPGGIGIEPQPRRHDGTIHTEYAAALRKLHREWRLRPEVTGRMHAAQAERMVAYTWIRDGECFAQKVIGNAPGLVHGSALPFSLELLEPDFVPLEFNDAGRNIRQGVQVNAWGRATGYHVYKGDPRDAGAWLLSPSALKLVPASSMIHVSTLDRLHQWRGVSEFASVLTRVEDLKDYEESERVAAKIAASLTAYVKRTSPDGYEAPSKKPGESDDASARDLRMEPGMILDNLAVGEEIGLVDTNRPNPNLVSWRSGQLRAYAAGLGASYSSISRDYDGTYSSLRQELVEQWVHYAVLTDDFVGMYTQPVWQSIVAVANLSGVLRMPDDVDPSTADDCLFLGQSMPWIDPLKEAQAWLALTQAGFASEVEVIRRRGGNPRDLLDQIAEWRKEASERALQFTSNASEGRGTPSTTGDGKSNASRG
ncbi:phage portal protein [Variovorax sp. J22P168]|uniref:phage portal protein n=1 Tax=Variovorax jilinensis TaxID=3053513 RepID=UPI0025781620|nr:phage portal protein [Variovorax sp. J22P168]MDM0011980.1 phage portal protein [Variovorax sp. J22P168]